MAEKSWPGQNTVEPEELIGHYTRSKTLERARFWHNNWHKTTALIDPPGLWDSLDIRIKIALCAVFEGGVYHEQAREDETNDRTT